MKRRQRKKEKGKRRTGCAPLSMADRPPATNARAPTPQPGDSEKYEKQPKSQEGQNSVTQSEQIDEKEVNKGRQQTPEKKDHLLLFPAR